MSRGPLPMPDFSGPIQSIELASWLWLILFFPLAGALTNALFTSGILGASVHAIRFGLTEPLPPKPAPARRAARIATWSLGLSAATALFAFLSPISKATAEAVVVAHPEVHRARTSAGAAHR